MLLNSKIRCADKYHQQLLLIVWEKKSLRIDDIVINIEIDREIVTYCLKWRNR